MNFDVDCPMDFHKFPFDKQVQTVLEIMSHSSDYQVGNPSNDNVDAGVPCEVHLLLPVGQGVVSETK